jgi:hypothetical protein
MIDQSETGDPERSEPDADREAAAAAAEAAAIGGPNPNEDLDPAERPLAEAGEGEAEGFELAERDLIGQASHEDVGVPPTEAAFGAEEEGAESVYGEPDEIDPTEVVSDPREDDDDPGAGPGLAADR